MKKVCSMPMVALRGLAILPNTTMHFDVSRKESVEAIKLALASNQYLFVVTQLDKDNSQGLSIDDLQSIGCIVKVRQMVKLPKNIVRVLVDGECRGRLLRIEDTNTVFIAETEIWEDTELSLDENEAYCRSLIEEVHMCYDAGMKISPQLMQKLKKMTQVNVLVDNLAEKLPFSYSKRQMILDIEDLVERIKAMLKLLHTEAMIYNIRNELQDELKGIVEKNQREYVLREQQKMIQAELGEKNVSDIDEYKDKLCKLNASEEVISKIGKEIKRLEAIPVTSSESAVVRTYVETMLEYPWGKQTEEINDVLYAETILNEDHYGLEKVKDRILDYLAVRQMVDEENSPIICLVGPPGTGKTSIAHSIAKAIGKEYVRISLGGVHDEAEIRGHRRTYVGAMPGRIVSAIMKTGVNNPLILFDEIDKMGSDFRGDPSAAMLEVLDSEQNCRFVDHYIEIPIDLSHTTFLATANDVSKIPKPLLDRMEIIELSSYTQNEKYHIAKEHLIEKQRKKHGLKARQLQIDDAVINQMILGYTREAGVRNLERQIATICRKADRYIATETKKSCKITVKNLQEYLGVAKYDMSDWDLSSKVGVVNGLAWTSVGGDVLQIEVCILPGTEKIIMTGNLGDVMKESAQLAVAYVKSKLAKNVWKDKDIHIHVPEGAVPKDGPSAGITMTVAVYSAFRKLKVRGDLAMTGEVTLNGNVLPIGGLKEKILAAKNHGIKEVLVPSKNRKDILEIDTEIVEGIEITYVEHMDEVLKLAIKD